ncbi:MAG: zf-HC2 domain-containing protein [Candidatus Aminicenantes bacterium]|nr:zf-HC2 domain-containing protein [Candidatus Aminicenantes bacterium]
MRCKDCQYLFIESSERELTEMEREKLEEHIMHCPECTRFKESLEGIRLSLRNASSPLFSQDLHEKTGRLCRENISKQRPLFLERRFSPGLRVPAFVWAALLFVIVLTAVLLYTGFEDLNLEEPVTWKTIALISLILQNALMLFFAPVIFRRYGKKRGNLLSFFPDVS